MNAKPSTRGLGIEQIIGDKRQQIIRLASQYGAVDVRIFGSVARGEGTAASDVDLLVRFEQRHSLLDRIGLKQDLEELLGRPVDVVTEKSISRYIRDRVLREAVPL